MRVAMVTPMLPESAIADVMLQAVPTLAEHWELEIWCPDAPSLRACPVPLHTYGEADPAALAALSAYDLVVYVLGNSTYHSEIVPLARALPGLVVLHDVSVTNLVGAMHGAHEAAFGEQVAEARRRYGSDVADDLRSSRRRAVTILCGQKSAGARRFSTTSCWGASASSSTPGGLRRRWKGSRWERSRSRRCLSRRGFSGERAPWTTGQTSWLRFRPRRLSWRPSGRSTRTGASTG